MLLFSYHNQYFRYMYTNVCLDQVLLCVFLCINLIYTKFGGYMTELFILYYLYIKIYISLVIFESLVKGRQSKS